MIRMTHSPSPLQRPLCPRGSEAQPRFLMMNLADLEPLPTGPGWFDSSWELETGLEVCEGGALEPTLQSWFEAAAREAAAVRAPGVAPHTGNQAEPRNRSWARPSGR